MNAYTTDPEEIRLALMQADTNDVRVIGDGCAALAEIIVTLTRQVEAMNKVSCQFYSDLEALGERLDALDDKFSTDSRYLQLAKRIEEIARRVHDLERGESPHEELFEYVESLEHKVNGLAFRTADMIQRLDKLEAQNKEAIEQAIAQMALDSGLAHL